MPSKKKKYNARFPAGRIKKIMQTDEEVGKVAQAVPVIISRTLELFVESLLTKTLKITNARNAKTLSPSHMKQCIISESRFDFLRDLVKNIPDMGLNEDLSGSEAGYGNEGTSPASTSTSSSSYSNGGPAVAASAAHLPYEVHSKPLLRSESYSPATASISVPQSQQHHHHHHHQHPQGKRGLTQQGGSLNFYKEIPLDGTDSPPPPPPPKLARLNSAPAASTTSASNVPFKIDILPTLQPATGTGPSPTAHSTGTGRRGQTNPQPSSGAITPQISYKFEGLAATPTSEVTLEPVIKLDYSNLRLPATSTSPHGSTTGTGATAASRTASLQPTIKIDLSSIAGGAATSASEYGTPKKHNTTESVAATGGGGGVIKQTASPSGTSTTTTVPLQSPVVPAAPPLFSALSSTIPGMDEDYDDI